MGHSVQGFIAQNSAFPTAARMAVWAAEFFQDAPIAYIQTDYFGGVGGQEAIVWATGELSLDQFA